MDVVYGHRLMIDQTDGQIGAWVLPPHSDLALTLADFVPQETLFWRRRIWDEAGGFVDPRFGYALDWDLLLRFRDAGAKMVRFPRFLGAFRIHAEQKTTALEAARPGRVRSSARACSRPEPVEHRGAQAPAAVLPAAHARPRPSATERGDAARMSPLRRPRPKPWIRTSSAAVSKNGRTSAPSGATEY